MLKKLSYYLFILSTTSRFFPYLLIIGLTTFVVLIGMNAYFFGLFSAQALDAEGIDNVFGGGWPIQFGGLSSIYLTLVHSLKTTVRRFCYSVCTVQFRYGT